MKVSNCAAVKAWIFCSRWVAAVGHRLGQDHCDGAWNITATCGDFFAEKAFPEKALPVGAVLTIAAAGSEASKGCVITKEETGQKLPVNYEGLRTKFAVMDPSLTFTLSPYQTACGAADIMAHVLERYFTQEMNVDLSDRLCEGTLKTMIANTPIVMEKPGDYDARAEIMWAGTIAHNDLLGKGRIEDWASHQIEHELSAICDVAHGAGLAIVLPGMDEIRLQAQPAALRAVRGARVGTWSSASTTRKLPLLRASSVRRRSLRLSGCPRP